MGCFHAAGNSEHGRRAKMPVGAEVAWMENQFEMQRMQLDVRAFGTARSKV